MRTSILLALLVASAVHAAGPLLVTGAGEPAVWGPGPIPYNPDQGSLGVLDNATAVANIAADFDVWANVPTASISFTNAGALPEDVTVVNWETYLGVCDGLSPIVFDADGSLTDELFGPGASANVLGFAGPECGNFHDPTITIIEGFAVLNGRFIDGVADPEIPLADFDGVFVHEFGHYVGLDHSQLNHDEALDGDPLNDEDVPTMFPFIVGADFSTLHLDDRVSLSTLYPAPAFATDFGTITGTIFRPSAGAPFQGVYVVARDTSDPRQTAVAVASGDRFFPDAVFGPPPAALEGRYTIPGLPPGDWTVEIEQIDRRFQGGSSVGPISPPVFLDGPPEFWNGANESTFDPPDDPTEAVPIAVAAGTTVAGIDVTVNVELPVHPANGTGLASVAVVRRNKTTLDALDGANSLALSPGGDHVYVTGFLDDTLTVFARDAGSGGLSLVEIQRAGPNLPGLKFPTTVVVTPDGTHVYVAAGKTGTSAQGGAVTAFARNAATGKLTFVESQGEALLAGAVGLAISPDGKHLYATSPHFDTLVAFARDPATGLLTFVEGWDAGVAGAPAELNVVTGVTVSPDGQQVYAHGGGTIVVFDRDGTTGKLTVTQILIDNVGGVDGLRGTGDVVVSGDGKHVYAGGGTGVSPTNRFNSDGIGVFARDPVTGHLDFVENQLGGYWFGGFYGGVHELAVSGDGTRVYGQDVRGGVVTLDRDAATGKLVFLGGEDLLEGHPAAGGATSSLIESPDGRFLYAVRGAPQIDVFRPVFFACTPAPKTTCRRPTLPGGSTLLIKDAAPFEPFPDFNEARRDLLTWRWRKGEAITLADLGDPASGATDYAFCIYDQSAGVQPVAQMLAPAGGLCAGKACWKTTGAAPGRQGFAYKDRALKPNGIDTLAAGTGSAGTAQARLGGKGIFLLPPTQTLPFATPVVVQLQAATGACWEATYSAPIRNLLGEFRATAD